MLIATRAAAPLRRHTLLDAITLRLRQRQLLIMPLPAA